VRPLQRRVSQLHHHLKEYRREVALDLLRRSRTVFLGVEETKVLVLLASLRPANNLSRLFSAWGEESWSWQVCSTTSWIGNEKPASWKTGGTAIWQTDVTPFGRHQ